MVEKIIMGVVGLINDEYGRDVNEPVLWSLVQDQVIKLNPKVTEKNVESVISGIKSDLVGEQTLIETNRVAHNLLTSGRQTTLQQPDKEPVKRMLLLLTLIRLNVIR